LKSKDCERSPVHRIQIRRKKTTLLDMGVTTPIKGKTAEKLGLLAADSAMGLLGKTSIKEGTIRVEISKSPAIATLGCSSPDGR